MTDDIRKLLADVINELKVARGDAKMPDHLHPASHLIKRVRDAMLLPPS